MEFKFTRSKASTIIVGILSVILGVIMFIYPSSATQLVTSIVGWAMLISGIVALVSAFSTPSVLLSSMDLYWGILGTLLGILIVNNPGLFVAWIFILLGIFIMMAGFQMLFGANALRVAGAPHSGSHLALAIIMVILGMMVMMSPFAMADVTMMLCGCALIYTGIVGVIDGVQMKSDKK
ncbi:MAG: HdeD family acid-resistance protein [Tractidigestivibacter sp.]|uniref:HdeD family acid-resistance protein n=1 Tax=Tractidigestivibacter sp. TaxID=2847320 RepID=UPI003D9289C9